MITELAALATAFSGSCDSAAAMVATSAPVIEKITVTMAAVIPSNPKGRNPSCAVQVGEIHRLARPETEHIGRTDARGTR